MKINKTKMTLYLGLVVGIIVVSVLLYINLKYQVEIRVSPSESTLTIGNEPVAAGISKLKRGTYEIIAKKPGFLEQKMTMNIPSDKQITINLVPEKKIEYNTEPFLTHSLVETRVGLIGVDKTSGDLVLYQGDVFRVVYGGNVRSWSYNHPWISVLDNDKRLEAIIINTDTNERSKFSSPTGKNIEAVSISKSGESTTFLTNSNPLTRKSDLYLYDNISSRSTLLTQTNATNLQILGNNLLLLVAEADAELATTCSIYNLTENTEGKLWQANRCLVNDDKTQVLIESTNVIIYDSITANELNTTTKGGIAWSGNKALVIRRNSGVTVDIYQNLEKIKTVILPISNYLKVIGATESHVTLRTLDGEIVSYTIE